MSRLTFGWVTPLLARGMQRPLQREDLFELQPDMQPSACSRRLWVRAAHDGEPSHVQRMMLTYRSSRCARLCAARDSTRQRAVSGTRGEVDPDRRKQSLKCCAGVLTAACRAGALDRRAKAPRVRGTGGPAVTARLPVGRVRPCLHPARRHQAVLGCSELFWAAVIERHCEVSPDSDRHSASRRLRHLIAAVHVGLFSAS
jgi:hypothetical protein